MKPILLCLCFAVSGCSSISYKEGPLEFSRWSIGSATTIGKLVIHKTSDGIEAEMQNYASDQVQAMEKVAEGAARGAAAGVKP